MYNLLVTSSPSPQPVFVFTSISVYSTPETFAPIQYFDNLVSLTPSSMWCRDPLFWLISEWLNCIYRYQSTELIMLLTLADIIGWPIVFRGRLCVNLIWEGYQFNETWTQAFSLRRSPNIVSVEREWSIIYVGIKINVILYVYYSKTRQSFYLVIITIL